MHKTCFICSKCECYEGIVLYEINDFAQDDPLYKQSDFYICHDCNEESGKH